MARVKRAVNAHKKRRAVLERAKGYRGQRSRLYRKAKADMQEVATIKANIDYLLGYSEPGRKKEQER